MRMAAKKEGERTIGILDDLLLPDPAVRQEFPNIIAVCIRARETLMVVLAQLTLRWEAAITFSHLVTNTDPFECKDFDCMWDEANAKFPPDEAADFEPHPPP